jgi:hypothetical protein
VFANWRIIDDETRARWTLHCAGAGSLCAWGLLAFLSRTPSGIQLRALLPIVATAWVALLIGWSVAHRILRRKVLHALWLWAVLMRIAGFLGEPVLEDDWARYLWDGREFALTDNPYSSTPRDHFATKDLPEKFARLLDEINNPDLPTIYGPLCQVAFLVSYFVAPGDLWPLKLILLVADLATLALLLRHVSPRAALIYAWCPLLIQEVAFSAHPEPLWIVCVVAALHLVSRSKPFPAALLGGVACGAKIVALLILPFVLGRIPRRYWGVSAVAFVSCYAWFWFHGSAADLPALRTMSANWEFNPLLFALIRAAVAHSTALIISSILFAIVWLALLVRDHRKRDQFPRGDLVYGCFFLCSAVVNPWYLLALLPFVALHPSFLAITALAIVPLSYCHGLNLPPTSDLAPFELPPAVRLLEVGALLLGAAADWFFRRRRRQANWQAMGEASR